MRAHPLVAVATLILVGVGVKLTFFSAPMAAANVRSTKSASIDVPEIHREIKDIPVENFYDVTFVFPVAIDRTIQRLRDAGVAFLLNTHTRSGNRY